MTRCLLDTDILSEVIKGKDVGVAAKVAAYLAAFGRLTTSAISVAEIVYGLRRVGREDRLRQFELAIDAAEVLPFDGFTARLAGRINGDLVRQGRIIGMPDVMIAAVALRADIPVVTGNRAHFEQVRVAGYELTMSTEGSVTSSICDDCDAARVNKLRSPSRVRQLRPRRTVTANRSSTATQATSRRAFA